MQAAPLAQAVPRHYHLQFVSERHGVAGRFSTHCPTDREALPDWLTKLRGAVMTARSGVAWRELRVLQQIPPPPGNAPPPQQIDEIVSCLEVFDTANRQLVVRPILDAANAGIVHMVSPPADVLDSLSQFVYQAIVSLIHYDNRVLYEGVTVDDGWALLRQLRESQAHLGLYIHMLEARRNALQCETLADYAAFKSSVLQLKHDWTAAINNLLIPVDDDWSLRKTKVFISDRTGPIFGEELAIWNADPANEAKTVDQLLEKATSIYRVKHRLVMQKRPADSTSFVTAASPLDSDRPRSYPKLHDQHRGRARYPPSRIPRMQQSGPTWDQQFPPRSRTVTLPPPPPQATMSRPYAETGNRYPAYPPRESYPRRHNTCITDTAVTITAVVKVTEINTTVVDSALNATQPAS